MLYFEFANFYVENVNFSRLNYPQKRQSPIKPSKHKALPLHVYPSLLIILSIKFDGTVVRGIFILNHLLNGKSNPTPCI